jgi:hypothetical protein
MTEEPAVADDRHVLFAIFGFAAGILSVVLLLGSLQPPPPTPADVLSFATNHRSGLGMFATLALAWAVFSVPLAFILGTLLYRQGQTLATIAQFLVSAGVLLLGFANFIRIGAVLSIAAAGNPPRPVDAIYQVTIWSSLGYYLTDPGLMTWGLGQLLFGALAWRSGVLPNWLAAVGILGGVAGLLTLAVYQTGVLALLQTCCFAVWAFAAGVVMLRSRPTPSHRNT